MKKLYKIELNGLNKYNICYAIGSDPTEAYNKVRRYLDDNNLGFRGCREMKTIELIAESNDYPDCETKLYI